jgi:Zn-dependent protease with chaperone function
VDILAAWGLVAPLRDMLEAELTQGQGTVMLVFAAFYWIVLFGYLSRRFEQQADVFATRVSSDPSALIAALHKLALLSGIPARAGSWRHFSIWRRTEYLTQLAERPGYARRAEQAARVAQCLIAVLFLIAAARLALRAPELTGL